MVALVQLLDKHAGVLALVALILAWLLYRLDRWRQRSGVLRGLNAELAMHGMWVGHPYSERDRGSWPDPDYLVYKLVTVATDDAITRGPGLFLNPLLSTALIAYRQVIGHFNQLIDKQMDFQGNVELYGLPRRQDLVDAAVQMTESIHIQGIGDASLEHPAAAFVFYNQVVTQLGLERDVAPTGVVLWFVSGLNVFPLQRAMRAALDDATQLISRGRRSVASLRRILGSTRDVRRLEP